MVASDADPAAKTAQVLLSALKALGFDVNLTSVAPATMYTRFCNVPKQKVQVCPNVAWLPDFPDGYAYLYATFNGNAIVAVNNTNFPQLNDPAINSAMAKATTIVDPTQRADAWGQVDRMITADAAVVPLAWDRTANIESKDVRGVIAKWNATWDESFTSVK